jgi:hypothetical protein
VIKDVRLYLAICNGDDRAINNFARYNMDSRRSGERACILQSQRMPAARVTVWAVDCSFHSVEDDVGRKLR